MRIVAEKLFNVIVFMSFVDFISIFHVLTVCQVYVIIFMILEHIILYLRFLI